MIYKRYEMRLMVCLFAWSCQGGGKGQGR